MAVPRGAQECAAPVLVEGGTREGPGVPLINKEFGGAEVAALPDGGAQRGCAALPEEEEGFVNDEDESAVFAQTGPSLV